ncbi:hypothetical protein [Sphaerisporangium krabiense]|uniref:Uncharacterized protein n=1 Tax=Sphaerisporangium krabiense TaxID=763782 RepID=A0A7W8ZD36_9ACTN|nr:hypothetical protein [Sphaerisporangium krabiense]MBB5631650.1 hypothetical protein [Sphaerisporangium krabiense]
MTLFDRLRIERLVWTLDQQLYDLPHHSRVAKRREVRANLLEASRDVGTSAALKRLGGSRRLAAEYLDAELGRRRHSWIAAVYFLGGVPLLLNFFLSEAAGAYERAITAADPHATGTYTWRGVSYLQSAITYTFDQGHASHVGGAWSPLVYVLWIGGAVACGRLWRLLPRA